MMKKYLMSFVMIMIVSFLFSQDKKETTIVGVWKYAELGNKDGLDEETNAMLDKMFGELVLTLKEDGTYTFNDERHKEQGTYTYNKKKKILAFDPETKKTYSTKVVSFETNKLEIKKGELELVLKRE